MFFQFIFVISQFLFTRVQEEHILYLCLSFSPSYPCGSSGFVLPFSSGKSFCLYCLLPFPIYLKFRFFSVNKYGTVNLHFGSNNELRFLQPPVKSCRGSTFGNHLQKENISWKNPRFDSSIHTHTPPINEPYSAVCTVLIRGSASDSVCDPSANNGQILLTWVK